MGNWNSGFVKFGVRWAERDSCLLIIKHHNHKSYVDEKKDLFGMSRWYIN